MDNKNYEIITREELVKHIKENKLEVKYYFKSCEDDIEDNYAVLNNCISSSPEIISGSKLYFDFDSIGDFDATGYSIWPEFTKMLEELKCGDLIIVEEINFGNYFGSKLLEPLSKLLNLKVELYKIDHDNEYLIKFDIRQLMTYILEALKDDTDYHAFQEEMISEISIKYYDGKL